MTVVLVKAHKQPEVRRCLRDRVRDKAGTTLKEDENEEGRITVEKNMGGTRRREKGMEEDKVGSAY